MTKKVVSIQKVREDKMDKLKVQGQDFESLEGATYYFSLGWIKVDFGGAFVRGILEQLDRNRETIIRVLETNSIRSKENIEKLISKEDEGYSEVMESVDQQSGLMLDIAKDLRTPEEFHAMFDEDSEYLPLVGFVVMVIMVHSYSTFDYHRMLRDNWMQLSTTVEDFMGSVGYENIKNLG